MSRSRVIINTVSQAAGRILIVLTSLLLTAILTRSFGASGYGNYIFLSSVILIFVGLSDLGTTTIGVKTSVQDKERSKTVFNNILGLRLILSIVLFFIFDLFVFILPQFDGLRRPALIASLVVPFLILKTTSQAVLQTYLHLDLSSLSEVFSSLLLLIPIVLFFFLKRAFSLSLLMSFWVVSSLLSGIIALYLSRRYLKIKTSFHKSEIKKILIESIPLGAYLLIYAVYDRGIDSFVLKTFRPSEEVGYYGLAYKIHGNLILGAAFLMNSLFPIIASLKKDASLKQIYEKIITFLLLCGLAILTFGFFLAPLVINILAGKAFSPSITILRILLVGTLISYLNHLTGYLMVCLNEQKKLLSFAVVVVFVNLILNLIFIPQFSFIAAAWITVLTELLIFILTSKHLYCKYLLSYSFVSFLKNFKMLLKEKGKYFD